MSTFIPDRFVCSIIHPSGGIYRWAYSVGPAEVVFSGEAPPHIYDDMFENPCGWTWQMIHEYRGFYPEKYEELQQYKLKEFL